MILLDFSQISIMGIQQAMAGKNRITVFDKDICRHIILNSIREAVFKFKREYGKVIICCDSRGGYWRKDIFPYYKIKRKKTREKSDLDWPLIYEVMDELKIAIKDKFPYKLIEVEKAEADDIIAALAIKYSPHEKILIMSSDGDFKQLGKFPNIKQYNKKLGVFVKDDNPNLWLKTKIIKGDPKDSITNILSPMDSYATGTRQKSVMQPILEKYLAMDFNDSTIENYESIQRNIKLMDLTLTPIEIKEKIFLEYESTQTGNKSMMSKYFIENNLINLLDCIDEF